MKLAISIYLLLMTVAVHAQTMRGYVVDKETNKPIQAVTILNVKTGATTVTDNQGSFALPSAIGDLLTVSGYGYKTLQRLANPNAYAKIELVTLNVRMPEYTVTDYTPFQKDSMEMTALYSKELNKKKPSVGFSSANGGGITGLIGTPIKKMSRSYKQNKRFQENFKNDMEQKYIDTRYTPDLVSSLTGYKGDTLAQFMNAYKMEHAFARSASDLELKMWVRDNFKEYDKEVLSHR